MTGFTSEELAARLLIEARFPKTLSSIQSDTQKLRTQAVRELHEVLQQAHRQGLIFTVSDNMLNWLEEYAESCVWSQIADMAYQVCLAHCQWYDSQTMEQVFRIMKKNAPDAVFLSTIDDLEQPPSAWEEVLFDLIISPIWNVVKRIFRLRK